MNDTTTHAAVERVEQLRLLYIKTEFASAVILTILSPISVVANVLLLFAVYRDPLKCLRKPVAYFIVNLSLADLICGLTVEPFFAFKYYAREVAPASSPAYQKIAWELYVVGGRISTATISSSFLLVLQLSVVQCMAIRCPLNYRRFVTKTRVQCCVVATWTYFIGFSLTSAFAEIHPLVFLKIHLSLHATLISVLLVIVQVLTYRAFTRRISERLLSQATSGVSSGLELTTRGGQKGQFKKQTSGQRLPGRQRTTERQFTLMTFYLAAVVLFSALPHVVVFYVFLYKKPSSFQEEVFMNIAVRVSDLLLFLKVAADPFLFAWRLPDYRQSLWLALKCKAKPEGECIDV